jgi:AraC-like DNA-binding protein
MVSELELYDVNKVEPENRFSWWRDVITKTHVPYSLDQADGQLPEPFSAHLTRRWIDDIAINDVTSDPCVGMRTRRHINKATNDYVQLTIPLRGQQEVGLDQTTTLRPGMMLLTRHAIPSRFEFRERLSQRTVVLPLEALEELAGNRVKAINRSLFIEDSPASQLFRTYVATLSAIDQPIPTGMVTATRNALLELLVGVLRAEAAEAVPGSLEMLRQSIDFWIDRQLSGGNSVNLNLSNAAAAHNVSIRTVHRAYANTDNTFRATVRAKRFNRARRDLADTTDTVQAIAVRWGYADASHFCRCFKETYDITPTDFRVQRSA